MKSPILKESIMKKYPHWYEIPMEDDDEYICLTCGLAYGTNEPTEKYCPCCLEDIPELVRGASPDLLVACKESLKTFEAWIDTINGMPAEIDNVISLLEKVISKTENK